MQITWIGGGCKVEAGYRHLPWPEIAGHELCLYAITVVYMNMNGELIVIVPSSLYVNQHRSLLEEPPLTPPIYPRMASAAIDVNIMHGHICPYPV